MEHVGLCGDFMGVYRGDIGFVLLVLTMGVSE